MATVSLFAFCQESIDLVHFIDGYLKRITKRAGIVQWFVFQIGEMKPNKHKRRQIRWSPLIWEATTYKEEKESKER